MHMQTHLDEEIYKILVHMPMHTHAQYYEERDVGNLLNIFKEKP